VEHYIVVVDDEPGILDTLCEVLEMEGYVTACVDHPDDTGRSASMRRPDLFLIDLMLPGMDGIALARSLRLQGFQDTPMIAMSASNEMVRSAKQSGLFQDAISKPFDVDNILDRVERLVV
jgi:CheY-like chemotaxis protein